MTKVSNEIIVKSMAYDMGHNHEGWSNPNAQYAIDFKFPELGRAMRPSNRAAYIKEFGKAVVEACEKIIKAEVEKKLNEYESTKYAKHIAEAQNKKMLRMLGKEKLAVGDYVMGQCPMSKVDSIKEFPEIIKEFGNNAPELLKVEVTKTLTAKEYDDFTSHLLTDRPDILQGFKGGSSLEDEKEIVDGKYLYIQLVMAISAPRRQTIFVDPQGYEYARYVYMEV